MPKFEKEKSILVGLNDDKPKNVFGLFNKFIEIKKTIEDK